MKMKQGMITLLVCVCFLLGGTISIFAYTPPTRDEVRTYARVACDVVGVTDQMLDMALDQSPLSGSRAFLDIFGYFMTADEIVENLCAGEYTHAISTASEAGLEWVISQTYLGQVLSSPMAVANLATLPIKYSLNAFVSQIEITAWNNQVKLYQAARRAGMTHNAIMLGIDDNNLGIFFNNGWLFSVGDIRIPPLGQLSPTGYTQAQVYGTAQEEYAAVVSAAYHQRDKVQVGNDFKKLLNPYISFSPASSEAPSELSFHVEPGYVLSALTIASYTWDFGDGQSGTGQSASHYYKTPGTYNVIATIADGNGDTHPVYDTVVIKPPAIEVTYPDGFESLNRNFKAPEKSDFKQIYVWDFGDGVQQTDDDPETSHPYTTSGYYTVRLTLTLQDNTTITSEQGIFVGPGTRIIQGHTIYGDETWYSGGTYEVQGSITVAQGANLTIEPGVMLKLNGGVQFNVNGTLKATVSTFTWADGVSPWGGIIFNGAGTSDSILSGCVIDHTSGTYNWSNEAYNTAVIYLETASPTIDGCTIKNSTANSGIWLNQSSSPTIKNSNISGFTTGYGVGIAVGLNSFFYGSKSLPTVTGNTLTGNRYGVSIGTCESGCGNAGTYQGNTISGNSEYGISYNGQTNDPVITGNSYSNNSAGDVFWTGNVNTSVNWNDALTYATSSLSINTNATLNIPSGKTVKIGSSIRVNGTLKATGSTFTWADGVSPWGGIIFNGAGTSDSILSGCVIDHTSGTYNWSNEAYNTAVIYLETASPTIDGCTIKNSTANSGIWLNQSSSPTIKNSNISGFTTGYGVGIAVGLNSFFYGSKSLPTVTGNTLTGNRYGVSIGTCESGCGNAGTYQGNTISGNSEYGIYYSSGTTTLTAINNNWGDPFGPLDDSDDRATGGLYNPTGKGNRVSDNVNYYPWTGCTISEPLPPTGLSGIPSNNAANLFWTAPAGFTASGYKIYYGTAPGSYGAPITVNALTAAKIAELSNGTPYYFAVSSLNSINAESVKSGEITVTPLNKYPLMLHFSGAGSGTVTSTGGGFTADSDTYVLFDPNTSVKISAKAGDYSLFTGWTGDCSGSAADCSLTMDDDKHVTSIFDKDDEHQVRLDGVTQTHYPSILAAYQAANSGDTIRAWGTEFSEDFTFNLGKSVILKGGYNSDYSNSSGYTLLNGIFSIQSGLLTVENLVIR